MIAILWLFYFFVHSFFYDLVIAISTVRFEKSIAICRLLAPAA
jgi:hypothetical protein